MCHWSLHVSSSSSFSEEERNEAEENNQAISRFLQVLALAAAWQLGPDIAHMQDCRWSWLPDGVMRRASDELLSS